MQLKNKKPSQAGFTLLELSIVILISVMLTVAIVKFFEGYEAQLKHEETKRSIINAETAISKFYELAGRYPCPANKNLVAGDADYGKEDCTATATFINGARDANGNGLADDRVMVGVLPTYATVKPEAGDPYEVTLAELIEDNEIANPNITDAWGNIPLYAVTEVLTKKYDKTSAATIAATFDTYKGAIAIVDENDRNTGGTKQDAHFVVISMGADGMGSKKLASGRNEDCSDTGYTLQKSNCDLADAKFVSGLRSTASDKDTYYDDYITFASTVPMTLWSKDGSNGISTVTKGNVGIGTNTPGKDDTDVKLEIGPNSDSSETGSILLVERATFAQEICDVNNTSKCVTSEGVIDLKCNDPKEYMKSVFINSDKELEANCEPISLPATTDECENGYVRGLNTNGDVLCIEKLPVKLEAAWIATSNTNMMQECKDVKGSDWKTTEISDNILGEAGDPLRSLSETKAKGSKEQLCMRTTDANVVLTSIWASGSCPAGTRDTGVRDYEGIPGNNAAIHNLTEALGPLSDEDYRDIGEMKWCLGVNGKGATFEINWASSDKRYPDCGPDETSIINARNGARNLNANELKGTYETLCAKVTMPQE